LPAVRSDAEESQVAGTHNRPTACCRVDGCGTLGTAIEWVAPPERAARLAEKEDKLLMVMHLSGNFAKEEFT